jgi:hypothetical protein
MQAYEKYEQYVNEVAAEEQRATRAAARRAASASASTSATAAGAAAAKSKPAVGRAQAPAAVPAAAAGGVAGSTTAGHKRREGNTTEADPTDKLEQQLDQWEQLVNFFELVDRDSKRSEARKQRRLQSGEEQSVGRPEGRAGQEVAGGKKGAAAAAAATAVGGLSLAAELEELGLSGGRFDSEDDDDEAQGEMEIDWQVRQP